MTWAYQLIIEFVVTHETAQMRAYSGKGNEAAAFPVNDDHGYLVENNFFGSAWRYVIFIDGERRIFGTVFWWNKKFRCGIHKRDKGSCAEESKRCF